MLGLYNGVVVSYDEKEWQCSTVVWIAENVTVKNNRIDGA